ncbi:hypothetical protein CPC08DRAFT_646420 [Agrocybe pediades]|nr:hypothetical protein CPC08DRAFT_646420 [Agrocybe pediades]
MEDRHTETSSSTSPVSDSESYQHFLEAVFSEDCAYYQLSEHLFVVNGWNSTSNASISWYHLQQVSIGSENVVVCMCPKDGVSDRCFHVRFMHEYGLERFPPSQDIALMDDSCFLITRAQTAEDGIYQNIFSIPHNNLPTIKNRAIVTFTGSDDGVGTWSCTRDRSTMNCYHVSGIHMEAFTASHQVTDNVIRRATAKNNESVSYQSIPPPQWTRIDSDPPPPPIEPLNERPALISITDLTSTCSCKSDRVIYSPLLPTERRKCIIYGLTQAWECEIEVQKCPSCKHRFIGPDCREMGIFNWNNRVLLTHHLLDDYTSSFTTSETPFVAWSSVLSRRYESTSPSSPPFMSEKLFRSAWFSYIRLVQFENDMCCKICGDSPQAIIFDGVSLAFNRKNVLDSLRPPTTLHISSETRSSTVRLRNLQIIPDRTLRKQIRRIIEGPSLTAISNCASVVDSVPIDELCEDDCPDSEGSSDEDGERAKKKREREAQQRRLKALQERLDLIPVVVEKLSIINRSLGAVFQKHFDQANFKLGRAPPAVYTKFFCQVSASETSIQMMNYPALLALKKFLGARDVVAAGALVLTPTLRNLLLYEFSSSHSTPGIDPHIFDMCTWLYVRGETVRRTLLNNSVPVNEESSATQDEDMSRLQWQKTGCLYRMPQIRHRPRYPLLKEDTKADDGWEIRDGCRKYYSRYSAKRLTGGIMVAWCTHSVCYGFHCIPVGEGRDDVFSALYTRWPRAPEIIVYDFACALQPYCMLREPAFFQDTLFVIDAFHAPDHSKCCPSAFLTTYCESDPRLLRLNSSAAECGNGGLARIRKSVSYMGQDRAILYTKVFLSVWNRLRIRQRTK